MVQTAVLVVGLHYLAFWTGDYRSSRHRRSHCGTCSIRYQHRHHFDGNPHIIQLYSDFGHRDSGLPGLQGCRQRCRGIRRFHSAAYAAWPALARHAVVGLGSSIDRGGFPTAFLLGTADSEPENTYELPGGSFITMGSERLRCLKVIFQPSSAGSALVLRL